MPEGALLTDGDLRKIDKLHLLLRIGLDDLKRFEQIPNCCVDMGHWLRIVAGVCHACLAGCVLHLELDCEDGSDPEAGGPWMYALNSLREGLVTQAYRDLHECEDTSSSPVPDRGIIDYHRDRDLWWAQMEQLYLELKREDL